MGPVHENAKQIANVCTKLRELAAISNLKELTELLMAAEQEAYRVQFASMAERAKSRIGEDKQVRSLFSETRPSQARSSAARLTLVSAIQETGTRPKRI